MNWLASKLGPWFVKWVLPFLYERFLDFLTDEWTKLKAKRAIKKENKEQIEETQNAQTPEELQDALNDIGRNFPS